MISVYDVGLNKYDGLGSCVLTPTKASHRQIAGGSYELTLEHPMDEGGKWQHLQNGAILKVPVPEETIEDAREGMEADIYRTVAEAELREEPSEPQQINYNEWNPSTSYTVGSKVTCSGWNHRNWKCTFYDESSPQTYVPPYNNNTWWTQIADYTSGSPVIVKLPAGETLYLVSVGEGWYQVMTPYGVQGYIKTDKVEFVKHVEPGEITSHVIKEQLFRITEVDIDNEANKVTAKARHVSYDLNGILCEDMEISQASAAMAISRIAQGLMMDYKGAIATNLTDTAGTYTQSIKGRNGGFCLLDPDRGVLPAFGAMLKRDNWDVFVLKKKHTDRGYRIRYGKNAKGISWQRKVQDLVTRVVPVAKNEDGSNLYLPEKWVDSTHIGEYPTVIMEWLRVDGQVGKDDGTGTDTVWTLENLYTEMRTKAGERYTVDKVDVPVEEVTVNFEQLGDSDEFAWLKDKEQILLYDTIRAIDERIGLEMDLYVTELEYDAIRRKVTGVKLSNSDNYRERTVTGFNVQDNSITPRKLTDEVKDSFLQTAVGVMPNYANANTWKPNTASSEGYVQKGEGNNNKVWATNGNGEPAWRNPGTYTLPLAADGTRGGVQIGYTQSGKNYPVQLSGEKMYVNVPWSNTTYTAGTGLSLSGGEFSVKTGYTSSGKNYKVQPDNSGNLYVNVPWTDHYAWDDITGKPSSFYTLPLAANGTRGGVQVGYTTSGKNYAVQLSSEKMYVNVPWENTTYSAGTGISISGTTITNDLNGAINALSLGDSPSQTADYLVSQYAGGGTTYTTYYRRPVGKVVNKTVVDTALGTNATHGGAFYRKDGTWVVPAGTTYSAGTGLSLSGTTFSVKTGYTTSGKNYKVQADSSGNLYVNVPWTDTSGNDRVLRAGDTMTGALVMKTAAPIKYQGTKGTYEMIKWIDNTADEYGNGISIGGGGLVIVGAGESSNTIASGKAGGEENLYIGSDQVVKVLTNCQSGISSAKTFEFNASGQFLLPNGQDVAKAVKGVTRSGATFTATCLDGTTFTFTQKDDNGWPYRGVAQDTTTDFNSLTTYGWYSTNGTTMTNGPASYAWGEVLVFSYGQWVRQGGKFYIRNHTGNPPTWGSWVDLTKDTTYSAGTGISISGTTITNNLNGAINALSTGSADSTVNDYLVSQYAGGGTTTTTYHRRPVKNVVNKTVVDYALGTNSTHNGAFYRKDGTWAVPPWRPVQNNLTSQSTTDSLSAYQGYLLANGYARDNRIQKIGLNPGEGVTIAMRQRNSFYFVVWRIGTENSGGIKVGHSGNNLTLAQSGTDSCSLMFYESGDVHYLIITNTHATAYMRGFMFGNNYEGQL